MDPYKTPAKTSIGSPGIIDITTWIIIINIKISVPNIPFDLIYSEKFLNKSL